MKKIFRYKRIYLLILLPLSFLLVTFAKKSEFFAEEIYALRIYKGLSQILSTITGLLPISLAEILIWSIPIVMVYTIVRFVQTLIKKKGQRLSVFGKGILNVSCIISVGIFLFTIFGGLNYYRYSFRVYSDLEVRDSTVEELYELTTELARQANELRALTPKMDENGVFQLSKNMYEVAKMADDAFELLAEEYPVFKGNYGVPKPVLMSKAMSYTEITGIFIPFTMEANVNVDITDYSIPSTMLHELAHLRGFMREDEANFIAYLASVKSPSIEFQYSGTMMALIHSGNALYLQSPMLYSEMRMGLSEEVQTDIRANSAYWAKFDNTTISTISNRVNDTYLRVNNQVDGVKSYGRMVDLLLAKARKERNL